MGRFRRYVAMLFHTGGKAHADVAPPAGRPHLNGIYAMSLFLGFMMPGIPEMLIIGAIALLLFGNRLPGAMRNLGRSVVEFKKGVKGVEDKSSSDDSSEKTSSEKTSSEVTSETAEKS